MFSSISLINRCNYNEIHEKQGLAAVNFGLIVDLALSIILSLASLCIPTGLVCWILIGCSAGILIVDAATAILLTLSNEKRGPEEVIHQAKKVLKKPASSSSGSSVQVVTPVKPTESTLPSHKKTSQPDSKEGSPPVTNPEARQDLGHSSGKNTPPSNQITTPKPVSNANSISSESEVEDQQASTGSGFQLFVKTPDGGTITVSVASGKAVKEVFEPLARASGGLDNVSLLFAGKRLPTPLEDDAKDWAKLYGLQHSSTLHTVLKNKSKAPQKPIEKDEGEQIGVNVKTLTGYNIMPKCPKGSNLKDFCEIVARKLSLPPLTVVRIIHCGRMLSTPEMLSKSIFKIAKDYEFNKITCIHALTSTLNPAEMDTLAKKLKEHNYPGLHCGLKTVESTLEWVKTSLWSNCDRIFRGKTDRVPPELEKQIAILKALDQDKDLPASIKSFVSSLLEIAKTGLYLYHATEASSYDNILQLIEAELQSLPPFQPPAQGEEDALITLTRGGRTIEISKGRLCHESAYYAQMLSPRWAQAGSAVEGKEKIKEEPTEETSALPNSPYLLDYLQDRLNLDALSFEELSLLLETAEAYIFPKLSLICQHYIVKLIKEQSPRLKDKDVNQELLSYLLDSTPYLSKVKAIWRANELYDNPQCLDNLQKVRKNFQKAPITSHTPKIVATDATEMVRFDYPGGSRIISKAALKKAPVLEATLFGNFASVDTSHGVDLDDTVPSKFWDFLEGTFSVEQLVSLSHQELQELLYISDLFGVDTLARPIRLQLIDKLIEEKTGNRLGGFINLYAHYHQEIESWQKTPETAG